MSFGFPRSTVSAHGVHPIFVPDVFPVEQHAPAFPVGPHAPLGKACRHFLAVEVGDYAWLSRGIMTLRTYKINRNIDERRICDFLPPVRHAFRHGDKVTL